MSSEVPLNYIRGKHALFLHLALARRANAIMQILGDPGIGKTEIMKTVADLGVDNLPRGLTADMFPENWKPDVFQIYVSQHDNIEFIMPFLHPETGVYSLQPSPLLTRLSLGYWLTYDECTLPGMQESMLQQCSGNVISHGAWTGPVGSRVMIGNKADNGNFAYVHNAVLGNRLRQYEWEPIDIEWLEDFALPYGIHPIIGAGVKLEGQRLFLPGFKPSQQRNVTPRSITEASDDLHAAEEFFGNEKVPEHVVVEVLAGRLPDDAVMQFKALYAVMDKLVPYPVILASPTTCPIPEHPSARFMTIVNVARRCNEEDWEKIHAWSQRLPIEDRGAVLEPILKRHPNLYATTQGQDYQAEKAPLVAAA